VASGSRDKRVRSIRDQGARIKERSRLRERSLVALSALLLGAFQPACSDSPRHPGFGVPTGGSGFTSGGTSGAFGRGGVGAASTGGFGATSTGGFGATSTGGFGATSTGGFGATSTGGFGATSSGGKFFAPDPGSSAAAGSTFTDPGVPQCSSTGVDQPLASQEVVNQAPTRRVLYSWTTPEQVEELRRDRQLFVRSEQVGAGRGFAFTAIEQIATFSDPTTQQLARLLAGDLFAKIRYAWPNPWATRMGWPGEDYGNQLLRIVLKESAWTVIVQHATITVLDMSGNPVPLATAIATPERIGAIFFVKDQAFGGAGCSVGTFQSTAGGATYREFILGNAAMVEEWSLATPEILQRLSDDIASLNLFFEGLRRCSAPVPELASEAACLWETNRSTTTPLVASYLRALSMASEYYAPQSAQVARLIETLEGDLFEPDPLRVTLGE
jgi:hypothetical protein